MIRWALMILALASIGCGKSFQEADAIYKDEVKGLEELNANILSLAIHDARQQFMKQKRFDGSFHDLTSDDVFKAWDVDALRAAVSRERKRYAKELQEREFKVWQAYAAREAAK